ncbi:helix-turn-helix domain-containing protein [Sorangium sp. So ce388]|uniref:helix-turn-helix domain-containing protein n=1 Tax=Sorangium sp. So ce388 TaxID=3133309 RepID=UPI003F5B032A
MLLALKMALMHRGVRQYDAARLLGITETRLSRIMCGRLEATEDEKKRLAQLLQTRVEDLFADADPDAGGSR